ncbi:hypothetical protein JQN72_05535 [Phycicoccus sp. CSK15P-2]|uniref:hypothetical protein n=1 Tax=Phycicoccus sp. CSK15P-2 TaxID=2807627 RepID=UPI00194FAD6A|nr:hypothetical protein [Phycicoccus sp. CSK15P-2]MBM6403701.1 hypothetical protein [Phycicoccus sp. CSK15P-2]
MVKRSVQAYVELASGLGEMTKTRALEAAQELVALAGVEKSSKKVAKQVGKVAEDLLAAAEHNREQAVLLVQREVETAVGRVLGDVQALGATVAGLSAQVDEIARAVGMRSGRASVPGMADVSEPVLADPPAVATEAPAAPVRRRPARASFSSGAGSATVSTGAKKTAASKSTGAKKTAAKKSTAKKTAASKSTGAKKSAAKKTAASKSTGAKKSAAKKTAASRSTSAGRRSGS